MFWKKLDGWLTRAEKKGFKVANKAHIYVVNGLLLVFAYNVATMFRDYNEFFLEARVLHHIYSNRKNPHWMLMSPLKPNIH